MSCILRSLGLVVVSALVVAGAADASAGRPSKAAQPAKASAMKPAKAATHSITGTLEKFDPAGKMITVRTAKGAETIALGADAHIMQGSRSVVATDLATHTGSRVEVTYTETNGQKTAQSVRLTRAVKK